jgi:hypothetical protein
VICRWFILILFFSSVVGSEEFRCFELFGENYKPITQNVFSHTPVTELSEKSIILDTQLMIAISEGKTGRIGQESRARWASLIQKKIQDENKQVWISDTTLQELVKLKTSVLPIQTQRLRPSVQRHSDDYKSILSQLEKVHLGGLKGQRDREIVADAFLARQKSSRPPTLVTADRNVAHALCRLSQLCQREQQRQSKELSQVFPDGFEVTLYDNKNIPHKINVIYLK